MSSPLPAIVFAVALAVTVVVLGMWGHYSERRPRHADAGAGALTVGQLQDEMRHERERLAQTMQLPRVRPGMQWGWCGELYGERSRPGRGYLPGWHVERTSELADRFTDPQLDLMARVRDGLRAL
ncbi:hypothetical protein [Actinopolyspora halophila]|uniref:hypothetical protein n=1 Tax=Actinopolyspora halophila TaxID=1850 RepID=UPI00037582B8|nr:hypothetical protein [Actinopolyspora halophila]